MILVAGGSGMLGVALQALYGKLGAGYRAFSSRGLAGCAAGDFSRAEAVEDAFRSERFDYVIHAAAFSDVDGCERDPERAYACNALTAKHLAAACARTKTPFVYVSTDYVFDGRKRTPYETDDRTGPVNVYGMTKLAGEAFVDRKRNPMSAIVRTSWLFGPGNDRNFVDVVRGKLKTESRVAVLRDQTDSPTYTADLAEALKAVGETLAKNPESVPRTLHFCNKGETTRYAMTLKMKEILGASATVEPADAISDRPAVRPAYGVLSTASFEAAFGVKIRGWEEGLKDYLSKEKAAFCAS